MHMNMNLLMCSHFNARLTPGACKINQEVAECGIRSLVDGMPVLAIDAHVLDKALTCSICERYDLVKPEQNLLEYIRADLQPLIKAVEKWFTRRHAEDEWHNSEEAREKKKAYNKSRNRSREDKRAQKKGREVKRLTPEERRKLRHPKIDQAVWDICEEYYHHSDYEPPVLNCIIMGSCPICKQCATGLDAESDDYIVPLNEAAKKALKEGK